MPKSSIEMLDYNFFENKSKIFDIEWNPQKANEFSICDFEGKIQRIEYNPEEPNNNKAFNIVKKFKASEESIYCLNYSDDGLLSGSSTGELRIIEDSKIIFKKNSEENKQIDEVKFIKDNIFCSTEANGAIKLWDMRQKAEPIFKFKEQEEEITDLEINTDLSFLLATSIDGTLGVYDIRKPSKYKLYALSDNIEDEIYSMKIIYNGHKVACGTSEGPIVLFDWDWFGDYKDRIIGHNGSVNTLAKYDENILISGCEDGQIRFVNLYPNYIKSMIIDKSEKKLKNKMFSEVTKISLNQEKEIIASLSNINYVKVYNIPSLSIENIEENDNADSDSSGWEEEEVIDLNPNEEENKELEDSSDGKNEESLEEKEIDINDNKQLEALLADGDFGDILKNIKIKKINENKNITNNKENEEDQENLSNDDEEFEENGNNEDSGEEENEEDEENEEKENYEDSEEEEDSESESEKKHKKKKNNNKVDKLLKFKALGKKRNSDWIIEKEKRKDFFTNL